MLRSKKTSTASFATLNRINWLHLRERCCKIAQSTQSTQSGRDSLFDGSKPKKLSCNHIFHIASFPDFPTLTFPAL